MKQASVTNIFVLSLLISGCSTVYEWRKTATWIGPEPVSDAYRDQYKTFHAIPTFGSKYQGVFRFEFVSNIELFNVTKERWEYKYRDGLFEPWRDAWNKRQNRPYEDKIKIVKYHDTKNMYTKKGEKILDQLRSSCQLEMALPLYKNVITTSMDMTELTRDISLPERFLEFDLISALESAPVKPTAATIACDIEVKVNLRNNSQDGFRDLTSFSYPLSAGIINKHLKYSTRWVSRKAKKRAILKHLKGAGTSFYYNHIKVFEDFETLSKYSNFELPKSFYYHWAKSLDRIDYKKLAYNKVNHYIDSDRWGKYSAEAKQLRKELESDLKY